MVADRQAKGIGGRQICIRQPGDASYGVINGLAAGIDLKAHAVGGRRPWYFPRYHRQRVLEIIRRISSLGPRAEGEYALPQTPIGRLRPVKIRLKIAEGTDLAVGNRNGGVGEIQAQRVVVKRSQRIQGAI